MINLNPRKGFNVERAKLLICEGKNIKAYSWLSLDRGFFYWMHKIKIHIFEGFSQLIKLALKIESKGMCLRYHDCPKIWFLCIATLPWDVLHQENSWWIVCLIVTGCFFYNTIPHSSTTEQHIWKLWFSHTIYAKITAKLHRNFKQISNLLSPNTVVLIL